MSSYSIDFSSISLPNPVTPADREAGLSTQQTRAAEKFANQRDGVLAATLVVKDLHVASNAETAINSEFSHLVSDPSSLLTCELIRD